MDHCPACGTELCVDDIEAAPHTLVHKETSDLTVPCRDCQATADRYGTRIHHA